MAEQNADITKTLVEAVNDLREYIRVTAQRRPEPDFGDSQLLPERIELPAQDARPGPAAGFQGDVVIPLPRQRHYEEGYLLPEEGDFPVNLTVTSGTSTETGTATPPQCGYEYDVEDARTSRKLAGTGTTPAVAAVDPIVSPHKWVRPTVGYMIAATFGYAHYTGAGVLVIGWINEIAEQEACGDDDGSTYDQGTWTP